MNNQVNEVLAKIREVCDLKRLEFGCEVKQVDTFTVIGGVDHSLHVRRHSDGRIFDSLLIGPNWTIIGLPVQLNHLLWALGQTSPKPELQLWSNGQLDIAKAGTSGRDNCIYDLQKSVEDNLRSNPELTKWVHDLIVKK